VVTSVTPEGLVGRKPGPDERTDAEREDERAACWEETGLTPEDLERRAYTFEAAPRVERVYRVTPPPRFAVGTLPSDRTVAMGPGTFTEAYSRLDGGVVEARFRFEAERTEWSVEDVKAFREAFWKRFSEAMPELVFTFEPAKLLDERRPAEAVALARRWLAERPDDAQTRARFARMLAGLGLNDLARQEVERALRDAPDDPLTLMVCGDVLRGDPYGVRFRPPFERAKALECLRKAHQRLPDPRLGHQRAGRDAAAQRGGRARLRVGPGARRGGRAAQGPGWAAGRERSLAALSDLYVRARRDADLRSLYEEHPRCARGRSRPRVIARR
jgi:tetratricopeptide (TPR) repeat protein